MRRATSTLAAMALGLALACFGEDTLENENCETNSDCARSQECVKTLYQAQNEPFGWCRSDGKCAKGEQPGCACRFSDSGYTCDGSNVFESSQGPDCICCRDHDGDTMADVEPDGQCSPPPVGTNTGTSG